MPVFVEGLIFDLDGTLIDSRQDIVAAVNHALEGLRLSPLEARVVAAYVGDGVEQLMGRCLSHFDRTDLAEEAGIRFKEHYRAHMLDNTRLYSGVTDMLASFRAKRMAVITNKPEAFTLQILEGLGIRHYFSCVLGGDSMAVRKPDPAPVIKILDGWQLNSSQVVVVGDSRNDIEAGKKSGALTCAVTYGFKSRDELAGSGADWTIDRMEQLGECVY